MATSRRLEIGARRVAGEVLQHDGGAAERLLRVDDPGRFAQRPEPLLERAIVVEVLVLTDES